MDTIEYPSREGSDDNLFECLERITTSFIPSFLACQRIGASPWQSRIRLLPAPAPACCMLSALRVSYAAAIAYACLRENRVVTKRDIYYMARPLFRTPDTVDRALSTLSLLTGVARNDLNIVAAPKGIVVGNVVFVDEAANEIDVGKFGKGGCLIPSRPERMGGVFCQATAIVVLSRVEKEAAFHALLNEKTETDSFGRWVLLTGKGYPDHATISFLRRLSQASHTDEMETTIYILTDADPHGINIALCYMAKLGGQHMRWIGVRPSDNGKMFNVHPQSLLPLKRREKVLLQTMLAKVSREVSAGCTAKQDMVKEINNLLGTGMKFEMEALSAVHEKSGTSTLHRYVISRIFGVQRGE